MTEPIVLTDETLDSTLNSGKPIMLLLSNGEGLRGDFSTAFKQAIDENPEIIFAKIDPVANPQAAARFEVGSKPVLIGWCGEETLVRRVRPWGSDVPLSLDVLRPYVAAPEAAAGASINKPLEEQSTVTNTPVAVTDETFQAEVIESDLPVLIDFWAEWCGPCRMVAPILDKLADEFAGQVKIAKVDVDANPGLSQTFRIMSIPNMMAIKNKTIVFNQPGALPEPSLRDLVQQLIALEVPMPEDAENAEEPSGD